MELIDLDQSKCDLVFWLRLVINMPLLNRAVLNNPLRTVIRYEAF